jgi:hypothetical protein
VLGTEWVISWRALLDDCDGFFLCGFDSIRNTYSSYHTLSTAYFFSLS